MRVLQTDIAIAASPEQVWDVLADFDAYPEWNPFITSIAGVAQPGEQLAVALTLPGGRTIKMRPRVRAVEPARRFTWLGHLVVPHVFDGEHELVVQPSADGTTVFTQRETFGGALVPFMGRLLARTKVGFEAMNAALKERVERGATRPD